MTIDEAIEREHWCAANSSGEVSYEHNQYARWLEKVRDLENENERLRSFARGESIVTDYWKDDDGTRHVLTTDGEGTFEYVGGGLAEENAGMRVLLADCARAIRMLCRCVDISRYAVPESVAPLLVRIGNLGIEE